jgi:hypothetical protein
LVTVRVTERQIDAVVSNLVQFACSRHDLGGREQP